MPLTPRLFAFRAKHLRGSRAIQENVTGTSCLSLILAPQQTRIRKVTMMPRVAAWQPPTLTKSGDKSRLVPVPLFIRGLKNQPQNDRNNPKAQTENMKEEKIPPEAWIEALERTANAPWLFHLPNDPADRLKRSFTLIFQIILYLGRPQEAEKATQFLTAFSSVIVPPSSEIGRARCAVANITRAVVHDISSIPFSSPLREEQAELFGVFDALRLLHDVYLENVRKGEGEGEVDSQEWYEFWTRAEPVLLELAEVLDKNGFGLELEERKVLDKDS